VHHIYFDSVKNTSNSACLPASQSHKSERGKLRLQHLDRTEHAVFHL